MQTSEKTDRIYPALLALQQEIPAITKDKVNTFHHSRYVDINGILAALLPLCHKHGLLLLQPTSANGGQCAVVETRLIHVDSGQWIACEVSVPLGRPPKKRKDGEPQPPPENYLPDPQVMGSGITYGRRYGTQSLLALEAEDDDAEGAMRRNGRMSTREIDRSADDFLQESAQPDAGETPFDYFRRKIQVSRTNEDLTRVAGLVAAATKSNDLIPEELEELRRLGQERRATIGGANAKR